MPRHSVVLPVLLLALMVGASARAQFGPPVARAPQTADEAVKIRATADVAAIRPGERFHLAVAFEVVPHWHIYWREPGASGAPTELEVKAPAGFTVGPVRFPRPKAFVEADGTTFGYERETVLFIPVTAPRDGIASDTEFSIDVYYLVCRGICLMGRSTVRVTLPRETSAGPRVPGPDEALLRRHRARLPLSADAAPELRVDVTDGELRIEGPRRDARTIQFLPINTPGVELGAPETIIDGDRFRTVVRFELQPQNATGPMRARGLVGLGETPDGPSYLIDVPLTGEGK